MLSARVPAGAFTLTTQLVATKPPKRNHVYPGTYAQITPEKPAAVMAGSGEVLTYAQLEDNSARLARVLLDGGLRRGDVVALLAENCLRYFEVYWAALRSGLYVTPINRHLTADEVSYIVADSGADALVVSATLNDVARQVAIHVPNLGTRLAFGGAIDGYGSYEQALADAAEPLPTMPLGAPMLYSSGTTGRPKGIKPPLRDLQVDSDGAQLLAPFAQSIYKLGTDDVFVSPAPLYHAAPLLWTTVMQALGATVVVMEKFDAEQFLRAVERYRATAAQVVPTMFVRLLKLPAAQRLNHNLSNLKCVIHAGAPCPAEVKQQMIDWLGPIIYEYYASTESNGLTSIDSNEWLRKRGSVGRSAQGVIHICGETGEELACGKVGTVYYEREQLPFEYHNDPEKTRAAQHPEHPLWTTVGDLGYVDEDGYLFLTDRKSFMISGGVNIYPQEVENVLVMHPEVADVAVIGVAHPEMGEEVKAVVQPADGVAAGPELEAELISYVRERIAHYKAPRTVDFVDTLPRTPAGKLAKGPLRLAHTELASERYRTEEAARSR
jgi:long-chain acyl-CoA synthetase